MASNSYLTKHLGKEQSVMNKAVLTHLSLCFKKHFGIELVEEQDQPGHHASHHYQFFFEVGPMVWLALYNKKESKLPATVISDYQSFMARGVDLEITWLERVRAAQEKKLASLKKKRCYMEEYKYPEEPPRQTRCT
eukprot:m51a1_g12160 hypothetical protein (136) ;mRNA; f:1364-1879